VLGLYFHTDTVPAPRAGRRNPFALTRESDRPHGLGAADMKGSIAAAMLALRAADTCGVELAYDLMFLLCTDEEAASTPACATWRSRGCWKAMC